MQYLNRQDSNIPNSNSVLNSTQTIGNYRLGKTLGQGSYAKVKSKYHLNLYSKLVGIDDKKKEKVAIKIISKSELTLRSPTDEETSKLSA